ncbi:Rdx family-domain-containing protein [Podospora aff. communis PSN243]|uniref:Rdx family-domain-containing protein n=1 Tax=Podospora aff. communis PSN243 TaxID=3040156 RepID=A0AAV9H5Q8_9PEZI|nr:Rdx family-domain-containing protein [Podospora aff. communis PSN243]
MASPPTTITTATTTTLLPRVTIQFCTQCKWLLRAAYFAQELLSTFSISLGEVALQPTTGGIFIVSIVTSTEARTKTHILWDRKIDGGFPETKELKRRVRDVIEPERNLGHVDRDYGVKGGKAVAGHSKKECSVEGECKDCE